MRALSTLATPIKSVTAAPTTAAISSASASEMLPREPRNETVTDPEFSATKMMSSTSSTSPEPSANHGLSEPPTGRRGLWRGPSGSTG